MLNFRQRYCKFFVHAIRFRLDCQPKLYQQEGSPHNTCAHARTLRLFHEEQCRCVYLLSINLLDLFSNRIKCRLFVGKIWEKKTHIAVLFMKQFEAFFDIFAVFSIMKSTAFYEVIGGKTLQKRLRFYMERVTFLYRNACKT